MTVERRQLPPLRAVLEGTTGYESAENTRIPGVRWPKAWTWRLRVPR
jgi:hypothetical protein